MKAAAFLLQLILFGSFICCGLYFVLSGSIFSCGGFFGWIIVSILMTIIVTIALSPLILIVGLIGHLFGF